ncbi:hypothetical protein JTB14_004631 [Gonioctena quinquepunctata]|nr:hypothetical protein JTB14_004631 [Gonioctena quinquepunctata]
MPFGLLLPATWQMLIDSVLGPDLEPHVFVYLDDVVIVTQTFGWHLAVLEEVFRILRTANLTVSREKCRFCRPEMKYLGYVVTGTDVDPAKVTAMLQLPVRESVKDVRRVVGMFSWYRRFIPEFASLVSPIICLLKTGKKFDWTAAFDHCRAVDRFGPNQDGERQGPLGAGNAKEGRGEPAKISQLESSYGKLYKYVQAVVQGLGDPTDEWKLVVPKESRKEVLAEAHDLPTAGHMGTFKTYNRIME